MKYVLGVMCALFLVSSCDDGDIISVDIDFDETLELCSNGDTFLLYDTKNDPSESLTLLFPTSGNTTIFATGGAFTFEELQALEITDTTTFDLGGNQRFNYRSYNRNVTGAELCGLIPPADLTITSDFEAFDGEVTLITTFIDDDNDGIPSADEGQDPNNDGIFDDAEDFDDDGIPDYLDSDDDNDNVPTAQEIEGGDDGDPLTNPLDTDNDNQPNYKDIDDDGDDVLTRLEDEDGNGDLTDDFQESADGSSVPPRYLDATSQQPFDDFGVNDNSYTRVYTTEINIVNLSLEILNATQLFFGTYTHPTLTITQPIE